MNKYVTKINRLITRSQAKCITKAAQLLCESDAHDAMFYAQCQQYLGEKTPGYIEIGTQYAMVKIKQPATKQLHQVTAVGGKENV